MKITDIKCYVIESTAPPQQFRWRKGLPGSGDGTKPGESTFQAIIKIETDEGICGLARDYRGKMTADIVSRRLKKFIGFDPLMTEKLWEAVWEVDRIEEFQAHALGLLDTACWDIKARKADLPLYQLLGGYTEKVPAYASTVTWETMDEYEHYIKICIEEGFTAFKIR